MHKFAGQILTLALATFLISSSAGAVDSIPSADQDALKVGTKAPNFTRTTAQGKKLSLKEFRGKKTVVLYFYPKDESPGCTKEACGFRDFMNSSKDADAEIIGVSSDTDESHKAFATHYTLPFDLVSDSDNSLLKLYHVALFKGTMHKRVTFVIDKRGYLISVTEDTNDGEEHVKRATAALLGLDKK